MIKLWDPKGIDDLIDDEQDAPDDDGKKSGKFFSWLTGRRRKGARPTEGDKGRAAIGDALQAWKDATAYFENVTDPALIDYAAYEVESKKRRYLFLLGRAKAEVAATEA